MPAISHTQQRATKPTSASLTLSLGLSTPHPSPNTPQSWTLILTPSHRAPISLRRYYSTTEDTRLSYTRAPGTTTPYKLATCTEDPEYNLPCPIAYTVPIATVRADDVWYLDEAVKVVPPQMSQCWVVEVVGRLEGMGVLPRGCRGFCEDRAEGDLRAMGVCYND
ncbi:hypothetical protein BJX64DRAFT_286331 [Aspergillus heterothallicus]